MTTFPRLSAPFPGLCRALVPALVLALCALAGPVRAQEAVTGEALKRLRATLEAPGGLSVESARQSPVPGLLEVKLADGPTVYATPDGTFFVLGDLYSVGAAGYVNLAEQRRNGERQEAIAAVDSDDDYRPVLPEDLIYDSTRESWTATLRDLARGPHVVTLRFEDARGNTTYRSVTLEVD